MVLAKQAAIEAGAFEALLVRDGIVTEGGATNAYCVRNGVVWTHPANNFILAGVTRAMVLEAAQRASVEVREEAVPFEQFIAADEAFISSTTMDIMPTTKIDNKPVGDGKPGEVTRRLIHSINEIITQELEATATTAR